MASNKRWDRSLLVGAGLFTLGVVAMAGFTAQKGSWLWHLVGSVAHAAEPTESAIVLRWERLPVAVAYLIEIAEDKEFRRIVLKERVSTTYYRWHTVVRRDYYWRVRGIDRKGWEGEPSQPSRIAAEVSPPTLIVPKSGKHFGFAAAPPRIMLRWEGSAVLKAYRLQIARGDDFARAVVDEHLTRTTYTFKPRSPGEYHWQVKGIALDGKLTQPSPRRSFVVFAPAPEITRPTGEPIWLWETDDFQMQITWSARPVASYEIDVAADRSFKNNLRRLTSRTTSLSLAPEAMGTHFVRVRGVGPRTKWSKPTAFTILPAVPEPKAPASNSKITLSNDNSAVELGWEPVPRIKTYEVALYDASAETGVPVRTVQAEGNTLRVDGLSVGRYEWTVRAVYNNEIASEPSAAWVFELVRPEPIQVIEAAPVAPAPAPAPAPALEAEPSDLTETQSIFAGGRVGFLTNLGAMFAPRFGMEISYHLPQLDGRLRVGVRASYLTDETSRSASGANIRFDSRLHIVSVDLAATYAFSTPWLDITAGGGLSILVTYLRVDSPDQLTLGQTNVEVGGIAIVGVERQVWLGTAFCELSYALTSKSSGGMGETDPGGLGLVFGYRLGIW